jgi:membrane protein HdeD
LSVPASPALRWLTIGLLFAGAGLALVLPFASATLLTIALGGLAAAAGLSQLLRVTGASDARSKLFRGLSGALYILGGISLVVWPVASEISLTLFIGFLLAFEGIMELAAAAAGTFPARGLVLLDGIVTALLGGMLIAEWPSDSVWAIGTLFGIALAFSAVNLITAPQGQAGA